MFGFFTKRKKGKIFGQDVVPMCQYCRYNSGKEDVVCLFYKGEVCKKYDYDPLKRKPFSMPTLGNYTKEDFEL